MKITSNHPYSQLKSYANLRQTQQQQFFCDKVNLKISPNKNQTYIYRYATIQNSQQKRHIYSNLPKAFNSLNIA